MLSLTALRVLPVLTLVAACASRPAGNGPADHTTLHFAEDRGAFTYAVDGRLLLEIETRAGRLHVNGVDTGPYRAGSPVRILSTREIEVDGERRAVPPPR